MKIRDIMNINASRVQTGTSLKHVAEQFVYTGASDLCAVDATGKFVGVISEGDVMRAALFCCPTLVMNLRSGASSHNDISSAIAWAVAASCGSEPETGRDTVSTFLDGIDPS